MDRRDEDGRPRIRQVKLMADWGAFPLWAVPDHRPLTGDDPIGELAPDDLPLSDTLVAELRQWADKYADLRDESLAWPSERVRASFAAEGRRLLALVRAELGDDCEVVYFNEATGRVEV